MVTGSNVKFAKWTTPIFEVTALWSVQKYSTKVLHYGLIIMTHVTLKWFSKIKKVCTKRDAVHFFKKWLAQFTCLVFKYNFASGTKKKKKDSKQKKCILEIKVYISLIFLFVKWRRRKREKTALLLLLKKRQTCSLPARMCVMRRVSQHNLRSHLQPWDLGQRPKGGKRRKGPLSSAFRWAYKWGPLLEARLLSLPNQKL